MNVHIRNVDAAAVAKIKELAKQKNMSQEEYLRIYIENLAVLGQLKELDMKYANLVKALADVVRNNTEELEKFRNMYENVFSRTQN